VAAISATVTSSQTRADGVNANPATILTLQRAATRVGNSNTTPRTNQSAPDGFRVIMPGI
jgi:hypothetical protein